MARKKKMLTNAQESVLLAIETLTRSGPSHHKLIAIQKRAGVSNKTVKRAIKRLNELGLIKLYHERDTGPSSIYCFTLTFNGLAKVSSIRMWEFESRDLVI